MDKRQWYEIKAQAGALFADIYIYEQIGEDWFGEGVTAKQFVQDLASLNVQAINLHINSPGGSVFDGQAIYNALDRHPASVTTYIDGLAASIATVVALAGDKVVMAANALFMVHDPFMSTVGTAGDMRKSAEILDRVAGAMLDIYATKTGQPAENIAAAMAAETWYSAEEAQAYGFADEVAEPLKLAAKTFDLKALGFKHVPDPSATGRTLSAANEKALSDAVETIEGGVGQIEEVLSQVDPNHQDDADDDEDQGDQKASGDAHARILARVAELLATTRHKGPTTEESNEG